jgi:hypothetical protein
MKKKTNDLNYELFQVEELESRLENRWCTTTITDTCAEENGEANTSSYTTEKC